MEVFIVWIIFSLIVGAIGSERKIEFAGAFFLSIFLSPIIGLIITLISPSKEKSITSERICADCGKKEDFTGAPYVKLKAGGSVCGNCAGIRRTKKG